MSLPCSYLIIILSHRQELSKPSQQEQWELSQGSTQSSTSTAMWGSSLGSAYEGPTDVEDEFPTELTQEP